MKLYLGSRDYRPDGFLTVDIDPTHAPDILADVTDLVQLEAGTVDEICASHILEHLPWPLAYKALAGWARALRPGGQLRVAVPDMGALAAMIAEGQDTWGAMGLIFGLGRLENPLEAHQFGYTRGMLAGILSTLGFGHFDWWKHDIADASNGWMPTGGGRIAISLNVAAVKVGEPRLQPERVLAALMHDRGAPFDRVYAACLEADKAPEAVPEDDPRLTQRLHMSLIEARMRILYLEDQLRAAGSKAP